MIKKFMLLVIYVILLLFAGFSAKDVRAISNQPNTDISKINSPYDGSLKEKNYVGLQTFNISNKSGVNIYYSSSSTLYNTIYNAMLNFEDQVELGSFNPTADTAFHTAQTVLNDHPELFYVSGSLSASYGDAIFTLYITYNYTIQECKARVDQLNTKVNQIISSTITSDMSEFKKEIVLHDYIVNSISYDIIKLNNNSLTDEDHDVWGGLINNSCVCDGYAKSFKLLLNKAGINSIMVVSNAMAHAWNIVNIDGVNYQVDTTWDDPVPDSNRSSYFYFNLTDDEISDSEHNHIWVKTDYTACIDTKYGYLNNLENSQGYSTRSDNTFYYFNSGDSNSLYSMQLDGTSIKKINDNIRGYSPVIFGDNLYYRNCYNFHVYKSKIDGTNNVELTSYGAYNLYIKDGILHMKTVGYSSTSEVQINVAEKGDINIDGNIDVKDLGTESEVYNTTVSQSSWNSKNDLNNDMIVDIFDMVIISKSIK